MRAKNVPMDTREAGRIGGSRRAATMTAEQRSEAARKAVAGYWDKLSPEERSAEMKRRAAKRKKGQK
jgi:hypothetical protein